MSYKPRSASDETLIEAVRDCYEDGKHDLADGGVHPEVLADHDDVPYAASTLGTRLRNIAQSHDELVQVHGLSPDKKPRVSYIPSDEYDEDPTV